MAQLLLDRAQQRTPLIDGEAVTFVWRGPQPPRLLSDLNDWQPESAYPLLEVDLQVWAHTITLPADAYLEYAFLLGDKRLLDPFNPHTTPNGMGQINNYLYMPGAAPTPLRLRRRGLPRGTVSRHVVEGQPLAGGGQRAVWLYQPPTEDPCPLLVVLDGQDYLRRASLPTQVDNLIAQGRIQPVALALVASHPRARGLEYRCSDATLSFLTTRVLPLARAEINLLAAEATPAAHGILGASLGGLMALYAARRAPALFGRVLSQSGAFAGGDPELVLWDLIRQAAPPLRIWLDVGRFEGLLSVNRRMHELLLAQGCDVAYREYNAGHNFPAWRNGLASGLEFLFPASGHCQRP